MVVGWAAGLVWLLIAGLIAPPVHGQDNKAEAVHPLPLLVRARSGDTSAILARRYLNDANIGWLISEYNDQADFSAGDAVLVPRVPFRLGGLTPQGFQTVPVLAYPDSGDATKPHHPVSPATFLEQMRWLKTEDFTAITPEQLIGFMRFSGQLPRRSVLITLDTESRAFLDQVVPILERLGFTATIFVATDRVGAEGAVTWDQLRWLRQAGFSIGARGRHGRSLTRHRNQTTPKAHFDWVAAELRLARQSLEARLAESHPLLAYPHGDSDNLVAAMAAKLGFAAAFSYSPGPNPFFADRFEIHRTVIEDPMSLEQFGSLVAPFKRVELH